MLNVLDTLHSSATQVMDADALLKRATALKRAGHIGASIETLHTAYKQIAASSQHYPVQTFLRLPLYLQRAEQPAEAWREFNRLLVEGYPNQTRDIENVTHDHAVIYDKMRLLLHREKHHREAIKFGIFSHLLEGISLYHQSKKRALRSHISRNTLHALLEQLLEKAEQPESFRALTEVLERHLDAYPKINFPLLGKDINAVVFGKTHTDYRISDKS